MKFKVGEVCYAMGPTPSGWTEVEIIDAHPEPGFCDKHWYSFVPVEACQWNSGACGESRLRKKPRQNNEACDESWIDMKNRFNTELVAEV